MGELLRRAVEMFGKDVLFLSLLGGVLIALLALRIVPRKIGVEKFNDVGWVRKNKWKIIFFLSFPVVVIVGPVLEETIFRAPLIIFFGSLTPMAWVGVIVSSLLFALSHAYNLPSLLLSEKIFRDKGVNESEKVAQVVENIKKENKSEIKAYRIVLIIVTFVLGMVAGWLGVKYQSIYPCLILHVGWNLCSILGIQAILLLLVVMCVVGPLSWIGEILRRRKIKKRALEASFYFAGLVLVYLFLYGYSSFLYLIPVFASYFAGGAIGVLLAKKRTTRKNKKGEMGQ